MVKTLISNARDVGFTWVRELQDPTCLLAKNPKNISRRNIVTNPTKALKIVYIKKKKGTNE